MTDPQPAPVGGTSIEISDPAAQRPPTTTFSVAPHSKFPKNYIGSPNDSGGQVLLGIEWTDRKPQSVPQLLCASLFWGCLLLQFIFGVVIFASVNKKTETCDNKGGEIACEPAGGACGDGWKVLQKNAPMIDGVASVICLSDDAWQDLSKIFLGCRRILLSQAMQYIKAILYLSSADVRMNHDN